MEFHQSSVLPVFHCSYFVTGLTCGWNRALQLFRELLQSIFLWSWWVFASLWVNRLFCASLQSPGQYYFKPMMKEFRFEPSSQMIEVQEGQNLKIQITGYRTAYRSVESMENPMGCIGMCCAKCVSSSTPLFLQVWRRLSKSQFILIILCISTFFLPFFMVVDI